jgi:putative aldouronate transport system substrate-binding protein
VGISILYIRKDWLKAVHMTEPKTMDQLVAVAKAFKAANLGGPNTVPIAASGSISTNGQCEVRGFLNSYGAIYDQWVKQSNGTLGWGSVQPNVKPALLQLQKMYKAGLFAQDFAADLTATSANQLLASNKSGIMTGVFPCPLWPGITGSYQSDKTADWEVIELPTVKGTPVISQSTVAPSSFIFVKKGCAHPEAVVKAVNLTAQLKTDEPTKYSTTPDQVQTFVYAFACQVFAPWKNLDCHLAITAAEKSGNTSLMNAEAKGYYDMIQKAKKGDRTGGNIGMDLVFGKQSAFSVVETMKNSNRIMIDAYFSLPTPTMVAKAAFLKTNLDAAMLKVIMGADISTFDNAVSAWKKGGGNQITSEVNAWYSKNK